jgi:hypothetical protein
MKHLQILTCSLFILLVLLTSGLSVSWTVSGQQDNFTLKANQHWDASGQSGICVHGGNNLAIADLNGDGLKEIVTGGFLYYVYPNGSDSSHYAPLEILSWNGSNTVNLLANCSYPGSLTSVYTGDVDGDGKPEIITTGPVTNSSGDYSSLRIWSLNGQNLVLKASYEGKQFGAAYVSDIDTDGKPEIIVVGSASNSQSSPAQLSVFRYDGNKISFLTSVNWKAVALSVCAKDVNDDGKTEMVTAGYSGALNNSKGELRVWQFDEENLTLKSNSDWNQIDGVYSVNIAGGIMGNTIANTVKIADVDGDHVQEIVTGGFTYNGTNALAQVRIWNWNGETLNLEKSQEWSSLGINQVTSITLNDVNGDSKVEIVTCGCTAGYGSFALGASDKPEATLEVWGWDRNNLALDQKTTWSVRDGVTAWAVGAADIDGDGVTEIVTAGCAQINRACDPDVRIWTLPSAVSSMPFSPSLTNILLAVGLAAVATVLIVLIALVRVKKMPNFL